MSCARSRAPDARARVASVRTSVFLVAVLVLAAACRGDTHPHGRAARAEPSSLAMLALAAVVPPSAAHDVAGAAAAIDEPPIRGDLEVLGTRLEARRLPIPRLAPGRSASFRVGADRKGWFLRLPEGAAMKLTTASYARGQLFLGGGFGSQSFYAVDAKTGHIDWAADASDGGPSAAIIEDDKVVFNTESCTIFAVDARSGRKLWSRWLGDPMMSQPAAANGRVFTAWIDDGGNGYRFGALDLRTGGLLWQRHIGADVLNAPVLDDTDVYFTTMDGHVWSLTQQGQMRWHKPLRAVSAPWLDGNSLHVVRRVDVRQQQPIALAKASGETEREFDTVAAPRGVARPDAGGTQRGWEYEGARPTIVDGRIYQTIGNEVHCRDARTGALLWRQRQPIDVRGTPTSAPAVAGSLLVFGTSSGELYGLDIDTGLTAWAYDVGEPIAAQPTIAHGWVYATTTRGGLVGVQVADRTFGGWHMWGGNAKHSGSVSAADDDDDRDDAARGDDETLPSEGTLRLHGTPATGELSGFPLASTRVHASVHGFVASVEVEQTFTNPYTHPVEAVYLFPLPDDAAVDRMELRTGTRVIRGHIARREEARREYRAARSRGVLTSLLEQDRPNLFRQSIANVRAGDTVRVALRYVQSLPYEDGSYRVVYPMLAGPRYTPASGPAVAAQHDIANTATAPTATTPTVVLASGDARSDRVEFTLDTDGALPIRSVDSPTHAIVADSRGSGAIAVRLRDGSVAPDRDLDIRLHVATDEPQLRVLSSAPATNQPGYLTLLVHPRLTVADATIAKRELVLVVDTSSSMRGKPIELARAALIKVLDETRPGDTFRLLRFADTTSALSEHAIPVDPSNIARAKQWLTALEAGGATEMKSGLRAALAQPTDPERMRVVLLVTDGYIGNETEIFREVGEHLGQARVFAFGVGSAVNRYLLSRLAEVGRGDVQIVTLDEAPERAAAKFSERIARPFLTDISVDWGTLDVSDVYPRRVPDLFADRPLVVEARYGTAGTGTVTVRGRIAGRAFEQKLVVTLGGAAASEDDRLPSLWARTRVRDLELAMALRPSDSLREEITRIGLEHSLLTEYTAFIAVDESYRADATGANARVAQPVTLPQGVEYGVATRTLAWGGSSLSGSFSFGGMGRGGGFVGGALIGYGSGFGAGTTDTPHAPQYGASLGIASRTTMLSPRVAPRMLVTDVVISGSLSRETVRSVVRRQLPAFRACYERGLRRNSDLSGRISLTFTIDIDGHVSDAGVESTTVADAQVSECTIEVARRMTFAPLPGTSAIVVTYPFFFDASDAAPVLPDAPSAETGDAVARAIRALDQRAIAPSDAAP